MARPRTPIGVRKLRSVGGRDSVSHRKVPAGEPVSPPVTGAQPPGWTSLPARMEWKLLAPKLEAMGVLTEVDLEPLAILCEAHAKLKAIIKEGSFSVELWRSCQSMYGRFGLTPSDRARLGPVAPPKSGLEKFLAQG